MKRGVHYGNKFALGYRHSDEAKLKISLAGQGRAPWCKGKKLSEETKMKMSESRKGRVGPMLGKIPWNKGKVGVYSAEYRQKISDSLRGKTGEKSRNWQGGITTENNRIRSSPEYKLWRESVFARDDYTCVWCKERGGRINADHIKPFSTHPKLRLDTDNGRTLCVPCHMTTDTWGRPRKKVTA